MRAASCGECGGSYGDKTRELQEGVPIAIAEMRTDRVLEEYKKKYGE